MRIRESVEVTYHFPVSVPFLFCLRIVLKLASRDCVRLDPFRRLVADCSALVITNDGSSSEADIPVDVYGPPVIRPLSSEGAWLGGWEGQTLPARGGMYVSVNIQNRKIDIS